MIFRSVAPGSAHDFSFEVGMPNILKWLASFVMATFIFAAVLFVWMLFLRNNSGIDPIMPLVLVGSYPLVSGLAFFLLLMWVHHLMFREKEKNETKPYWWRDPVHIWFGLSYAHYFAVSRTALQSMPIEWQRRFVQCMQEMDEKLDWVPYDCSYSVTLLDKNDEEIEDPYMDYQRGRRRLPLKNKIEE